MPEVVPSSAPYRPTWEPVAHYFEDGSTAQPPAEFYTVSGAGPVWSDHSDSSWTSVKDDLVYWTPTITSDCYPTVVADFPAAPGVTDLTGVSFRALGTPGDPDYNPNQIVRVSWRLFNKANGSQLAAGVSTLLSTSPATYTPDPVEGFGSALSYLQAGGLCIEIRLLTGFGTVTTFDVWLNVTGTVPAPPVVAVELRRSVAAAARRGTPSLRMLQRGGSGGMSGIPRMVGDPTRRGIRQGPGSIY